MPLALLAATAGYPVVSVVHYPESLEELELFMEPSERRDSPFSLPPRKEGAFFILGAAL